MARQAKNKPQVRDIEDILNNASDRAKLQNFIDEAVRCKQKVADENESIKGLREEAVEKIGIEPKMFNALTKLFFNNDFAEKRADLEKLENAIDLLLKGK